MEKDKQNTVDAIKKQGMLPLFFHPDGETSLETLRTIYKAGVRVFEYTNRGPAALENFKMLKSVAQTEMPDLFLGIGTIKTVEELNQFLAAGADFIVCPVVDLAVGKIVHQAGKLWIPGCMTPTEINLAHQNGAGIIKLFPANILGPAFLQAVKELFQGQLFVPTGGVEIEEKNINSWFKSGVCAVGMGSKMISKETLDAKDFDKIYALTKQAFAVIQKAR